MRLILMYDLDMSDEVARKEYTKFHKWILARGFIMMQYSIYVRVINSPSKEGYEIAAVRKNLPKNGNIRIVSVTDRQYLDMTFLRGGKKINESINTEKRRIKIEHHWNDDGEQNSPQQ